LLLAQPTGNGNEQQPKRVDGPTHWASITANGCLKMFGKLHGTNEIEYLDLTGRRFDQLHRRVAVTRR
jgi:hypothetical protein